jgi:hypothetical protein
MIYTQSQAIVNQILYYKIEKHEKKIRENFPAFRPSQRSRSRFVQREDYSSRSGVASTAVPILSHQDSKPGRTGRPSGIE